MMKTIATRGAAVALLTITLGVPLHVPLGAQSGGTVSPARRDSMFVRIIGPNRAQLDTVRALMRQFEQLTPDAPARELILKQIESLMPFAAAGNRWTTVRPSIRGGFALPKGWIGINVEGPHKESIGPDSYVVEYFDHPSITSVDPDSPAQRAGIAPGDILIAYNGSDLIGHSFDMADLLVPDKKLLMTVRREGDTKKFTVTVAKAPEQVFVRRLDFGGMPGEGQIFLKGDDGPNRVPLPAMAPGGGNRVVVGGVYFPSRTLIMSPNGALGAIMSSVSPELARTLKLEMGVLVNDVSEDTPASKAGLRPGDVIVRAAGQQVVTLRAFQELLAKRRDEQSVALQIMRDKKARQITVSW